MAKYLLPCSCGRNITVETSHAGRQVSCECGISLEVPTMLALKDLQRVEETDARSDRQWGIPQALILIGLAILLVAIPGVVLLAMNQPLSRMLSVEEAKPVQTLELWKFLQQDITVDYYEIHNRAVLIHRVWIGIIALINVVATIFVIGGWFFIKRGRQR
jgi:hypothetical protein